MLRKVSNDIFPYACRVMEEEGILYDSRDCGGYQEISTSVSSRKFNGVIDDAKAMMATIATGGAVVFLSYRTAVNPVKVKKVLEKYNTDGFVILEDKLCYMAFA